MKQKFPMESCNSGNLSIINLTEVFLLGLIHHQNVGDMWMAKKILLIVHLVVSFHLSSWGTLCGGMDQVGSSIVFMTGPSNINWGPILHLSKKTRFVFMRMWLKTTPSYIFSMSSATLMPKESLHGSFVSYTTAKFTRRTNPSPQDLF